MTHFIIIVVGGGGGGGGGGSVNIHLPLQNIPVDNKV